MSPNNPFEALPNEIIGEILSYLTPYEKALARIINQSFKEYLDVAWMTKHGVSFKNSMKIFKEIQEKYNYYRYKPQKKVSCIAEYVQQQGSGTLSIILLRTSFYRLIIYQLKTLHRSFPESQAVFTTALQNVWINKINRYSIARIELVSPKMVENNLVILKELIKEPESSKKSILLNSVAQDDSLLLTALLFYPTYQLIYESLFISGHINTEDRPLVILAFATIELLKMENALSLKKSGISLNVDQLEYVLQQALIDRDLSVVEELQKLGAPLSSKQLREIVRIELPKLDFGYLGRLQDLGAEFDLQQIEELIEIARKTNPHDIYYLEEFKANAIGSSQVYN